MEDYECEKCGAPASLVHGSIARTCACNGPVLANMRAVAYGEGHAKTIDPSPLGKMIDALREIGRAARGL